MPSLSQKVVCCVQFRISKQSGEEKFYKWLQIYLDFLSYIRQRYLYYEGTINHSLLAPKVPDVHSLKNLVLQLAVLFSECY
jgi:hypothetical protein